MKKTKQYSYNFVKTKYQFDLDHFLTTGHSNRLLQCNKCE